MVITRTHLPLIEIRDDLLGFERLAREISAHISSIPSSIPYAISLNGQWGSGKSTLLNFLEQKLDESRYTIIRFNSWDVIDKEFLIKNLFDEIEYTLNIVNSTFKEAFKTYSQKIVPPVFKTISYVYSLSQGLDPHTAKVLSDSTEQVSQNLLNNTVDKPISILKKELSMKLRSYFQGTDQKIIVLVDEIDRLYPDELITIFQMIKSALDFPGILFVVAMDEEVIESALRENKILRPQEYLDKVFQRSYYIKSDFQVRTLVKRLILDLLEETDADQKLKDVVNTYFFLNRGSFVTSHPESIKVSNDKIYTLKKVDYDKLPETYFKIYWSLIEECNLANPRKFIKFSQVLIERWREYFNSVLNKNEDIYDFELQGSFLAIVLSILMPREFNHTVLDMTQETGNVFLKRIYEHLVYLIPEVSYESDGRTLNTRDNYVFKKYLEFLYKYPDFL